MSKIQCGVPAALDSATGSLMGSVLPILYMHVNSGVWQPQQGDHFPNGVYAWQPTAFLASVDALTKKTTSSRIGTSKVRRSK